MVGNVTVEVPAREVPVYDFSKVCPCHICSEKTKALMEFEIDLQSKHARIRKLYIQLFYDLENFMNLMAAFVRTTQTWTCLQHSRKSLHEKSGVPLTRSKSEEDIRDVFNKIGTILVKQERANKFVLPDECEGHDDEPLHLYDKIDSMFVWFQFTKFEDVVYSILRKMKERENHDEQDGESAEEGEMSSNLSISKRHLDKQIKHFKELPFRDMYLEFEEFAGRGVSRKYRYLVEGAMEAIWETYRDRDVIRERFHKQSEQISPSLCYMDRETHLASVLEETLDLLLDQAESFREVWANKYERHFAPSEEPEPKKQKI